MAETGLTETISGTSSQGLWSEKRKRDEGGEIRDER
jgi:hypothetical protein